MAEPFTRVSFYCHHIVSRIATGSLFLRVCGCSSSSTSTWMGALDGPWAAETCMQTSWGGTHRRQLWSCRRDPGHIYGVRFAVCSCHGSQIADPTHAQWCVSQARIGRRGRSWKRRCAGKIGCCWRWRDPLPKESSCCHSCLAWRRGWWRQGCCRRWRGRTTCSSRSYLVGVQTQPPDREVGAFTSRRVLGTGGPPPARRIYCQEAE